MLLLRQLEFAFRNTDTLSGAGPGNPGAAISDRGYKKPGVSPGEFAGRIPAAPQPKRPCPNCFAAPTRF